MKYRIVQKSANCFEPQIKGCFWSWDSWMNSNGFRFYAITFKTYKEALDFINKYHAEHHEKKYPIIHEIEKE